MSPFPGMDPYLEAADIWLDFHAALVNAICSNKPGYGRNHPNDLADLFT